MRQIVEHLLSAFPLRIEIVLSRKKREAFGMDAGVPLFVFCFFQGKPGASSRLVALLKTLERVKPLPEKETEFQGGVNHNLGSPAWSEKENSTSVGSRFKR